MGRRSRHSPEVRERSVRMVLEHQVEHCPQWAAICRSPVGHSERTVSGGRPLDHPVADPSNNSVTIAMSFFAERLPDL